MSCEVSEGGNVQASESSASPAWKGLAVRMSAVTENLNRVSDGQVLLAHFLKMPPQLGTIYDQKYTDVSFR